MQQTERVKKRRRESAQRSRQRKNAYMHALEVENRALKAENERLRLKASRSGSAAGIGAGASYVGPAAGSAPPLPMLPPLLQQQQQARASSGSVSRQPHEFDCSGEQHPPNHHPCCHAAPARAAATPTAFSMPTCPGLQLPLSRVPQLTAAPS